MIGLRREQDIAVLMAWRREVISHVFGLEPTEALLEANRQYYRRNIPGGSHQAFVASYCGEDAGVGAICLSEELPSPDNPSGRCAYLMNIYVRERFRRRGIAKRIINHLVDVAKELGCGKIYLESTEMAKPLYGQCGFADMRNMMEYEGS